MLTLMTKPKQKTLIMHKVLVFNDKHIELGFGWLYYHSNGKVSVPELYHHDGTEIPSGNYILVHTEENHLVVVPRQKQ
jgi:hypothetical protein